MPSLTVPLKPPKTAQHIIIVALLRPKVGVSSLTAGVWCASAAFINIIIDGCAV
jgi:hypothetical protein